jgi:hypothetical protein
MGEAWDKLRSWGVRWRSLRLRRSFSKSGRNQCERCGHKVDRNAAMLYANGAKLAVCRCGAFVYMGPNLMPSWGLTRPETTETE